MCSVSMCDFSEPLFVLSGLGACRLRHRERLSSLIVREGIDDDLAARFEDTFGVQDLRTPNRVGECGLRHYSI
jgi:hypothetical protein